jgi:hypothetical protein
MFFVIDTAVPILLSIRMSLLVTTMLGMLQSNLAVLAMPNALLKSGMTWNLMVRDELTAAFAIT